MNRFRSLLARLRGEDGFSLPFIASMLVVLLGLSAFAVDLGWIYLNGGRLQRAADSAALAGVIYLPHDLTNVQAQAVSGANANGWSVGTVIPDGGASQNVGTGPDTLAWRQLEDNKLQVELTSVIDTFFLKVLGFDELTISRKATAQFIKPVPLGSPANCIGIGEGVGTTGLDSHAYQGEAAFDLCEDYTQNFWSAINGRRTALEHGDPYGPTCGYECDNTNGNSAQHDPYYYFAIDVPAGAGSWVDVYLYDAAFYARSNFAETGDSELANSTAGGTKMQFTVFAPDTSPQIPENNLTAVSGCSDNIDAAESGYRNQWRKLCRINNPTEGIYVLRVANEFGSSGNNIGGTNSYALMADSASFSSSAVTRIYSLNEMGIFTNDDDGNATVYIAEVDPIHANKILELSFFDPGETSGNGTMTVVPPSGVSGYSCSWTATNAYTVGTAGPLSGSGCSINTATGGNSLYNGEWITMQIQLPANYTCNPANAGCFWKMNLNLVAAHDRTTWKARVIGNPVALVPNP
jgi:hypothetical protein